MYELINIDETSEFDSLHHEDSSKFKGKQMMLVKTTVYALHCHTDPFTITEESLMTVIINEQASPSFASSLLAAEQRGFETVAKYVKVDEKAFSKVK